ncbi:MAG: carbohydrate binding family 9 domain-containing protein [Parvularculaceae bacterium]
MRANFSWVFAALASVFTVTLFSVAHAAAIGVEPQLPANFATYTPLIDAARIDDAEAPVIDGDLSDPAWGKAAITEKFYQIEPVDGAAPSEKTRAYIMYDRTTLYVGFYMYDENPGAIFRSQMKRDPALQDDDAIRIFIDSYGTFRDAYFFGVNPNGARSDALIENGSNFRDDWDTIWRAKVKIVEDGWVAEFAIPFQSISFDPSIDEWNFQIIRTIRRKNEEIRWSNIDRSRGRVDMTNPGRLGGIDDISSGIGLEAQVFVSGQTNYDWETRDAEFVFRPSGNAFYKISPSLTGSLTFNTDFSDTPLDSRQVNTGRFSLFVPETRDFFLQDAAVFEFGGRVFEDNPNGLPFFSRNIGIVRGRPVDIVAGAKVSGKLGPANVGVIATRTGSQNELNIDGQYLSAARVSLPVLAESKVGLILTNGDPSGVSDNTVAGADFQYKRSNLFDGGTVRADFSYQRSFTDGIDDDMFAMDVAYRSLTWNATMRAQEIGEEYSPRLGFLNRTGIRRYNPNFWRAYRPANSFIRVAETGAWVNIVTDLDDSVLDKFYGLWAGGVNNAGDELWLNYEHGFLDIQQPFSIAGRVPVAAGQYKFLQYEVSAAMTRSRPLALYGEVRWGGIYDGDLLELSGGVSFRPSRFLELIVDHDYFEFGLPSGDVGIHISSLESNISFTPDMSIKTEVQYDNISEEFTFFSRFRWEPAPGREIFISLGHSAIIEAEKFPRDFVSQGSSLALRLGHTFRM